MGVVQAPEAIRDIARPDPALSAALARIASGACTTPITPIPRRRCGSAR